MEYYIQLKYYCFDYFDKGRSTAAATVIYCSACNVAAFTLEFSVITCINDPFEAFCTSFFAKLSKTKCY